MFGVNITAHRRISETVDHIMLRKTVPVVSFWRVFVCLFACFIVQMKPSRNEAESSHWLIRPSLKNRQIKYSLGLKLRWKCENDFQMSQGLSSPPNVTSLPLTKSASLSWSMQKGRLTQLKKEKEKKRLTCYCFPDMLLFIRAQQVQTIHQSHHNLVRAPLPAAPFLPSLPLSPLSASLL